MVSFNKEKFLEVFGFLLSQELTKASPKKTGNLARSIVGTFKIENGKIKYNLPYYFKYVEFGTIKQNPNPFFKRTIHQKTKQLLKRTMNILEKER